MSAMHSISAAPGRAAARALAGCLPIWIALWCAAVAGAPMPNGAPSDQVSIVGSSTVYPFSTLVAQHFVNLGSFRVPDVRLTSTGDGFKLFCAGAGPGTPDISNASRRISAAERATCKANGVGPIAELRIGYDSLVVANLLAAKSFDLTLAQLRLAAAKFVPVNGELVPNPYQNWHDIAPTLPDQPIQLFGPAPSHGTRDAFVELVMQPGCGVTDAGSQPGSEDRQAACGAIRDDGRWTDVEDLELILGKLAKNPQAIGVLTYSYLVQFSDRIHAATIDGVAPSRATIPSGEYPISRPLFIYLKQRHLRTTSGLADYVAEFVSLCAAGTDGYLSDAGLVPMPTVELLRQRALLAQLR
jgi:phosphate transport system substrate-binding protein